ncbi:MAG: class I SAM-dependent methyltransferase [Planctomycetota bacterium]
MLGDLLSDGNERRTFLVGFASVATVGVVLVGVGLFVPAVAWLAVVGVALLAGCLVLLTKLVVTTHVHLRGTSGRLIGLNDRYDATERWLERFDVDVRSSLDSSAAMHAAVDARITELKQQASSIADGLAALQASCASAAELENARAGLAEEARALTERITAIESAASALASWKDKTAKWVETISSWKESAEKRASIADKALKTLSQEDATIVERLDAVREDVQAKHEALASSIEEASAAAQRVSDDLESGRVSDAESLAKQTAELEAAESRLSERIESFSSSLAEAQTKSETSTRDAMRQELTRSTGELVGKIKDSAQRLHVSSSLVSRMRGEPYVQFPRLVTGEAEKTLTKLKAVKSPAELRYLERKLQVIEGICEGRLAGSTDDAVARALLTRSVKKKELRILEIGVLFGIGSIFMHQALAGFYRRIHLTLLDPFDGYYGPKHLDPLTGQPVTEDAVRRNLIRCGIAPEDVELVSAFSADDAARARVAEGGPYDSIVIDGDHSAEGIKLDYELYADLVAPGGVLIVDDYGSDDWPSVMEYTNTVIEKDARFTRIAVIGKTIAFRRKRGGAAEKASASSKRSGVSSPKTSSPKKAAKRKSAKPASTTESKKNTARGKQDKHASKPASTVEAKPSKKPVRAKARAAVRADTA